MNAFGRQCNVAQARAAEAHGTHNHMTDRWPAARLLGIRVVNYMTNHVVAHFPSYAVRHRWYRKVLGIDLHPDAIMHLGCYIWFYGPGGIRRHGVRIGANSHINRDCTLDLRGGLTIGDNVSMSARATVLTSASRATSRSRAEEQPVTIEDNTWIGFGAIIMPGVTIGRGATVGAGAVVTRDVAPLAVVFGAPARPVGANRPEDVEFTLSKQRPLFE